MDRPTHVVEVVIRTTPERLWQAITEPAYTRQYFFEGVFESTWEPGTSYRTTSPDGATLFEGTVLDVDPPRRLVYSFRYFVDEAASQELPSRVCWVIEPLGEECKLTIVHDEFAAGEEVTYQAVGGGWRFIARNLKTLLERDQQLPSPAI